VIYASIQSVYYTVTSALTDQFTELPSITGGLIQLNHGKPRPLQYVVNAAFLASVFSDYLEAADTPGWYCGPHFYSVEVLRSFARTQVGCQHFNTTVSFQQCLTSDIY
jgi:hypothetical protein